jgi:cytochrome c biogenesis protein CcmG, thiol:disulfide interchange protein DsbE
MNKTRSLKIAALAGIAGIFILYLFLRPRAPRPVEIGEAAPNFSLAGLNGTPIALKNYRHQVVVLNFWATWCPPCVEETPSLEQFAQTLRGRDVAVIGISVDQDGDALRKFIAGYHLSYPIARDPDQALAARFGTFKFPETYIIDRQGKVAEKIIGAINWEDPRIIRFVENLTPGGMGE